MKIRIYWLAIFLFYIQFIIAQHINGKVFDGNLSEPLSFANVVLLKLQDSSFVAGTTTDTAGYFSLQAENGDYLLRVSFIGYKTQIFPVKEVDVGIIYLMPDTQILSEITVTALRTIIKMENRGISADIQNSPLKEIGTASDVLEQLPFINKDKTSIHVFGKGTPLIFINNRQIRELSELENLNSNRIKKVTIITNPGVEYSASVKSVIKIETLKLAGEGLSGNAMARAIIKRKFSCSSFVNLNYRKNKLDIFGLIYYHHGKTQQNIDWNQSIISNDETVSATEFNKRYINLKSIRINLGSNYVFENDHSMGIRYEYGRYPINNSIYNSSLSAFLNNEEINKIESYQNRNNERTSHYINSYYTGKIASWLSLKLDIDFIDKNELYNQYVRNTDDELEENIATNGSQQSDLFASKLVFSTPVGKENLTYGGEFARTNNEQCFFVTEPDPNQNLKSNNNVAKQTLFATFITYGKNMNHFSIDAGVRFEHVGFDYFVNNEKQENQSRIFNHWFPNLNVTYSNDNFQAAIGYNKNIFRPSYYQLRSNVEYNNPYAYESGNPFLRPSISNSLSSSMKWKIFLITANYDIYKDAILFVSEPYTKEILLSKPKNFNNFKNLSISAFSSASIDSWKLSLEVGLNKKFFNYGIPEKTYNKPIYRIILRNNVLLFENIQLGADVIYSTSGNSDIDYMYNVFRMNAYLFKTFLNDKVRVNLRCDDIFGTDRYKSLREINAVSLHVLNDLDKRGVTLSVSYNFNEAKSKYKGEQASDEINRL